MQKKVDIAALFTNGGSQAVRLPKEYHFEGNAVRIHREGRAVILELLEKAAWHEGFWERLEALGPLLEDFTVPEPLPPIPHRDEALDSIDVSESASRCTPEQ